MATEIDRLEIKITADATQADKSLNKLVKSLRKVHRNMGHTTSSAKKMGQSTKEFKKFDGAMRSSAKSAKSLASAIGKFYATYFLVIRGIKQLWKSIESTTDYIEAFNYQNVALGKIASEWKHQYEKYGYENAEEYAKSFTSRLQDELGKLSGVRFDEEQMRLVATETKNLGLNLKEVTQYASQLASVTNSVGLTGESSIAASSIFTKLAGDISSLFNVDYSEVAKNLQSGLIGQSRALYKYGIDITNATLQTKAYELGITKAVSEMTQAEKMQLRMIAILEQSKVSWGDLANTINSPSNMLRQFTNNLKEVGMVLGQLFIPVLQKVLPFLNGVSIAIKRLIVDIAGFFGVEINMEQFGQGYSDLEDDLSGVEEGFEDATNGAKSFKNQLQGFDKLNVLTPTSSSSDSSMENTIDLTKQIMDATAEYEKVWNDAYEKMEQKAQKFADGIGNAFENVKGILSEIGSYLNPIFEVFANDILPKVVSGFKNLLKTLKPFGDFIKGVFVGIWKNMLNPALKFLGETIIPILAETIKNLWNNILVPLGTFVMSIFTPIIENLSDILTSLWQNVFTPLSNAIGNVLSKALLGIGEILNVTVIPIISSLISVLQTLLDHVLIPVVNYLFEVFSPVFNTVFGTIGSLITGLSQALGGVIDFITGVFTLNWEKAWEGVKDIFKGIFNGLITIVEGVVNLMIYGLNAFTSGFRELISKAGDVVGINIEIPDIPSISIPRFEEGGFPEDGWFRASHGEYFGQFDNGQSVIANNKQIISGIANGVRDANMEQNALLREQNQLLRQILAKDTGISSRDVFDAVRSENRTYINRNGISAFA